MTRPMLIALLMLPLLAGCDRSSDDGTALSISGGNGSAVMDEGGAVKIDTPAFNGAFTLPRMNMTADDFDIEGVRLYPGSRVAGVDVRAGAREADGRVTVRFDSPADVATIRSWFAAQFAKTGTKVAIEGDRIRGRGDDGAFTIDLTRKGARTGGVVTIGS